jgi:methylamine utilization protein MauE
MVQTITPVVHGGRRSRWQTTVALHALGAGVSAAAFGAVLGTGGSVLGAPWGREGAFLVGGLALLYAAGEIVGFPVPIPDRRRQVPEWWRSSFSFNASAFLYGLGLGIGFLTYVRYGTLVAVSAAAIASGDPLIGAALMAPFGVARGLSVAVVWSGTSAERVQRVFDHLGSLAEGPMPRIANTALLFLMGLMVFLLPPTEGGEMVVDVGPWVLALVFGWAAGVKVARFGEWRQTLSGYSLPKPLETIVLPAAPVVEATVAILALSGRTRESAALAGGLLIVFCAAILRARSRQGRRLRCGCFGRSKMRDYRILFMRNLAVGVVAGSVFLADSGRRLLKGFRGPHLGEAIPALFVLMGLALGASVLGHIVRLRRAAS